MAPGINEKYLNALKSAELLLKLTWDEWLAVSAPFENVNFSAEDVTVRYHRNGYDWDMHGTLYTPGKEFDSRPAFVCFHGGAGSEKIMDLTPDGRPGLARVLASQGFKALALTYPGHYPPGGIWKQPIPERMPVYLISRAFRRQQKSLGLWVSAAAVRMDGAKNGATKLAPKNMAKSPSVMCPSGRRIHSKPQAMSIRKI